MTQELSVSLWVSFHSVWRKKLGAGSGSVGLAARLGVPQEEPGLPREGCGGLQQKEAACQWERV